MLVQVGVSRLRGSVSELSHQNGCIADRMRRMADRSREIGIHFWRMDWRFGSTLIAWRLGFRMRRRCRTRPHVRHTDPQSWSRGQQSGREGGAVTGDSQSTPCQRLSQRTEDVGTESRVRDRRRGSCLRFHLQAVSGLMHGLVGCLLCLIPVSSEVWEHVRCE